MCYLNTSGADGTPVGGGEVLEYWGNSDVYNNSSPYLDNDLIGAFNSIPLVKILIVILILLIMSMLLLRLFNIRSPFKGRGITRELDYMEKIKRHDLTILRANKFMASITSIVEKTPFNLGQSSKEYWQYNITRAGIKIPGKARIMKAEEFHAVVMFLALCCITVGFLTALLVNSILGWIIMMASIISAYTVPMIIVREIVKNKDLEIKENFADYYLMLHYVLIANANTPLSSVMKSYAKTTSSKEMQKYIDSCIHYIDTYGEYEAPRYIAREFREISQVGKLMRLIRQANEGGEIKTELLGFRDELLKEKKYAIEKRMEKLITKARLSFNLLMPILVQAILSAMAIYMTDLGMAGSLFGL